MMDSRIFETRYADGALCVMFTGEYGPQRLSTNIEGLSKKMQPGTFAVKNWSENVALARDAWASGLFEDTGITIPTGYVQAPVWKIKGY